MAKQNVRDHSAMKLLSSKYGIPICKCRAVIMWAMKNMATAIEAGEDVEIQNLGEFRFDKELYSKYLYAKKQNKLKKKGIDETDQN